MSLSSRSSDFFVAGGALGANIPSYVERPEDNELFNLALAGKFCYVLTPRQMGKSSLMNRTARRLKEHGVRTVRIDLTRIGKVPVETWYLGLMAELTRQLHLAVDPQTWSQQHAWLGPVQRFIAFLREAVLAEIEEQVVIFIDEIDHTLQLDFSDDFFAAIRSIYNARDEDPAFERLNFILLGVASPPDLIKDNTRTPFNIGEPVILQDFSLGDAAVLQKGLEAVYPGQGQKVLARIFFWTNGHPYLTQRLCKEISEAKQEGWTVEQIDELVKLSFLSEKARKEPNLQFVQDKILSHPQHRQLLGLYRMVHENESVADDAQSLLHNQLKLSGLVKPENERLQVRNEIYRRVFNLKWVKENTQRDWNRIVARVAVAVAVLVILLASGIFWYNGVHVPGLADKAKIDFLEATRPEEQVNHLATLFELEGLFGTPNYDDDARRLFFGLRTGEEQFALFEVKNVRVIVIIRGLYITLADTDNTSRTSPLLQKMAEAMEKLEDTAAQRSEISHWTEARSLARQRQYEAALAEYDQAIDLNGDNPATLFERARTLVELSRNVQALYDLDKIMEIASRSGAATPTPGPTHTPTSTLTATPIHTATPLPTSAAEFTATAATSAANVAPAETQTVLPKADPTATPQTDLPATPLPTVTLVPVISEFVTMDQIKMVVRRLVESDPNLVSILSTSAADYPALRDSGLAVAATQELLAIAAATETAEANSAAATTQAKTNATATSEAALDAASSATAQFEQQANLIQGFIATSQAATAEVVAAESATAEAVTAEALLNVTPNQVPIDTPVPTDTATVGPPPDTPTPAPPMDTPPPETPPLSGKLAFPVDNGAGRYDVFIVSMPDGQQIGKIEGARQPDFRSDGQKLLINGQGGSFGEAVFEANAAGNLERPVSGSPTDSHPSYNPTGDRVAYSNPQLVIGADGNFHSYLFTQCSLIPPSQEGEPTCQDIARFGMLVPAGQVGEIQGSNPIWTDTDQIIYKGCNSWAGGDSCGLFTVGSWANIRSSNGETPREIADGTSLIPTDTKSNVVAFHSRGSGDWEAYLMDVNGEAMINLSNSPTSNDGLPTISPDGQWIAFASDREGTWAVYVLPSSGGSVTKLFDFPKANPWGVGGDGEWTNERMSWGR